MMFGQPVTSSLRLVLIVSVAVVVAIGSFANTFAMVLGVTAASAAGIFVVVILTGAFVSLSHTKSVDDHMAASNRLSNEDIG